MDNSKKVDLLLDLAKTVLGAGVIGIVVKDSDCHTKYLTGLVLILLFFALIFYAFKISKK